MSPQQQSIGDLSHEIKMQALSMKRTAGRFEAIKFLTIEHKIGLLEAKQYIEKHDEFGRMIHRPWIKQGNNIFVVVFTGVGILLLCIAGIVYSYQNNFINKAIRADAVVTESLQYGNGYVAVFGYYINNQYYERESGTVSTPPEFNVGEKVQIWVRKSDPYDIMVDTFMNRWLAIIILASIGFLFSLFGLLFYKIF